RASGEASGVELAPHTPVSFGLTGSEVSIEGTLCSGSGVALACCSVEQDSSYWEAVVEALPDGGGFGVGLAREMGPEQLNQSTPAVWDGETAWGLESKGTGPAFAVGDVIGVLVDFNALPMASFSRNGEDLPRMAVHRVKGTVFPAVAVRGGAALRLEFQQFKYPPPR
ncbi:unnamed protein product, partial [Phaeothamnion confervicola]